MKSDPSNPCPNNASHVPQPRSLTAELALVEEQLRRQVAVDLHDGPVQTMVLLFKQIRSLQTKLSTDHESEFDQCIQLAQQAIEQTRGLMYHLSPPILYDLGLVPALDWLVESMRQKYHLDVTLVSSADRLLLDRAVEVVCFRVVSELLINAVKYAPDSEVVVVTQCARETARIMVRDTGPGFDTTTLGQRVDGTVGFGLQSIREQVRGIGGEMQVNSVRAEGTRVTLSLPLVSDQSVESL